MMTETRPFVPWDMMNDFMIDVLKEKGIIDVQ